MKIIILFIFLLALIMIGVYFIYTDSYKSDKNDIRLGINDINNSSSDELLFYWAEWCGFCKKIKPEWNNSKKMLQKEYPNLKIKEVNCNDQNNCYIIKNNTKNIIEGVPTIILRGKNKDDIEYEKDSRNNILGNKKEDDIRKFLNLYLKKN